MKRTAPAVSPRLRASLRAGRHARATAGYCSLLVFAGLGLLGAGSSAFAQAAGAVLPASTLPVLRGVVAGQVVVNAPVRGATQPQMTIDQASRRAIIDWRSFNIGSDAEVLFRHEQGSAASTLNRIYDANPSVIQGRLTSVGPLGVDRLPTPGGQILLINQNGILFDRGSQVNTQALLASTLNLSMSNLQFCGGDLLACNAGAALTFGGLNTPAFEGGYDELGNPLPTRLGGPRAGTIGIGSFGPSTAAAPVLKAGAGGSIVLIGSRVDHNAGLISSPDGQVVLAAGNKVYLGISEDSADITLRGFRVEVEAAKDGPYLNLTNLVRNAGEITADRGNVTLAALAINQEGRISAKTAVQRNGSIYLTARTKDGADAGTLRLAAGSITEVVPDAADTATLPDSVAYAPYRGVIRAEAGLIESHGTVQAQGGRIGLEASSAADPTAARIYLGDGSLTSVAGAWADVDAGKNLASFRVTSNELKNSPDQKGGVLLGATVTVDLRDGNNLLALEGYRDAVGRTVTEKAAVGGQLSIGSTGSVIQRSGAAIDASGGGYRHEGGLVATTKLLGADGRIYDIATAPQQRQYVAQLDRYQSTDDRWGVTTSVTNLTAASGTFREAYVEGLAGGSVRIGSGAGLVLDGALKGGVTIGSRQLARAPQGAALLVGTGVQPLSLSRIDNPPVSAVYNNESQRIGNVLWRQQASDTLGGTFSAATALTQAQIENVTLAAGQVFGAATQAAQGRIEAGFGSVEVNSDGRITLPADVSIRSDIGASLTLRGPALDIAGDVRLPSGALTLAPQLFQTDPYDPALLTQNERTLIRGTSTLSVAGAWLNQSGIGGSTVGEQLPSGRLTASGGVQSATQGGSLTVRLADADFQTRLERGAVLDVSGGALLDSSRRVTGGRGGQLVLANGIANQTTSDWQQAELRGHALASGGSLTLNLGRAQIAPADAEGVLPSATTRLGADLFTNNGFSSVSVNAPNGIVVTDGTQVAVRQRNLQVDLDAALALPSGAELRSVATVQTLADHLRAPASLSLAAEAGAMRVGNGARLATDPGGSLSLIGGSALTVEGQLVAPGGRITLSLRGSDVLDAMPLRLGPQSLVSAAAAFVPTPSDIGLVRGNLLGGGTVTLDARQAGINTAVGSIIDVSGLERRLDIVADSGGAVQQQVIAGQAGTLVIKAQDTVSIGGTLVAAGPGTAAGGSFAMELMRADRQAVQPVQQRLVVSANGVDQAVTAGTTTSVLDANALQAAGFEKLRLLSEDRIEFQGTTALDFERGIRLDAPVIEVRNGASTTLSGATVSMGQSLGVRVQRTDDSGRLVWTRDDTLPQPQRLPQAGTGLLTLDASLVDFYGSLTVQGASLTRVNSGGDVRFISREVNFNSSQTNDASLIYQSGSLDVAGRLEFSASQLYPATRSRFDVQAHGSDAVLQVRGNGSLAADVYSVAGALTLQAPTVVQAGTVRAPQGELSLVAAERLELSPGSVTSVAGNGLTVLYGTTLDGVQWRYIDGNQTTSASNPRLLDAVSVNGKRLTLSAPAVAVAPGATINLRGGGNVLAVEFVAGNGGDSDVTNAADTFAIIPKSNLASIPYDSFIQFAAGARDPGAGFSLANGRDMGLYDSVQIGAGSRVPAGEYVLLPARFALLPDAYLVQLQTGSAFRNLQPGQTASLANGEQVVAGHRSARDTAVRESQSVGVVVLPGSAINRYSDYTLSGAQLFADAAERVGRQQPSAPWDAGTMGILNANTLSLGASFQTAAVDQGPYKGRAAEIDIAGPRIAIVDRVGGTGIPAGTLEIASATLSGLDASLLVGGTRTRSNDGVQISTSAQQVLVANSAQAPVELPELLISARDRIEVAAGSVVQATGSPRSDAATVLQTEASGALLRLSGSAQVTVDRGASANSAAGDIDIAAGATLQAAGSLLLDATRTTRSLGQLRAGGADGSGGAISLAASTLSLGQVAGLAPAGLTGLVLSNQDLAAYGRLDELTLRAYDRIDFLGGVVAGSGALGRLTLDTPLLSSQAVNGVSQATVTATEVQWVNRSSARRDASGGTGQLDITAQRLLIGDGEKASSGFGAVSLTATTAIEVKGEGSLRSGGALKLETQTVRVAGGADQRIAAVATDAAAGPVYGRLQLSTPGLGAAAVEAGTPATALGGRLQLEGGSVDIDTKVQARSGQISVTAQGADVRLGTQAVLDVAGETKNFNGSVAAVDGGTVALRATMGTVQMEAGSRVDVSAAALGGNAGQWQLAARSASLEGVVLAQAGATARGGAADIDLGILQNFSRLNTLLDGGGFAEERRVRVRDGDLRVAEADTVGARRVTLTADSGRIDVAGTVGRNTAMGGSRISLSAADGLSLAAGSRLLAAGTDVAARGGEVRVGARAGSLEFARGGSIDVRAGSSGPQGSVVFGVVRDANDVVGTTRLEGEVLRYSTAGLTSDAPASVDLEATRIYTGAAVPATLGSTQLAAWGADHQRFVTSASASAAMAALRDETGALTGARVLGATEVQAVGSLAIDSNWDLTSSSWRAAGQPGTLTVRAAGDLTLRSTLGAPGLASSTNTVTNNANNNINHAIVAGDTWNIRLTAGADLTAADGLTTSATASPRSLLLTGAAANIRTGTGRIDLAASGDIRLDNVASSIYTAGRIGAADTAVNGNNRWAVDGGGISLRAGGSVSGTAGAADLWVTDWFRRPRQTARDFTRDGFVTDWWSYRPRFQQGVGTLAGGDIDVHAAGNVADLLFALPTSGRTVASGGQRRVDVTGGGNLDVRAGEHVEGASFLLSRGSGSVAAGGDIGRTVAAQAYLMGVSSGLVPEQAALTLSAGGDATLASVDNPTYLGLNGGAGVAGPSFHPTSPATDSPSSTATTFFTYSANSAVAVVSKAGDVSVIGRPATASEWRSVTAFNVNNLPSSATTAFPANLALLSLDGSIAGPGTFEAISSQPNIIKTYPSATASLVVLAGLDIRNLGVEVSDLAPSSLVTPTTNVDRARPAIATTDYFDTGSKVSTEIKPFADGRITQRTPGLPPALVDREASAAGLSFDVQALTGSIVVDDTRSQLYLPARSRVRAGANITDVDLQLQNLSESDVSEVRAVSGDITKRSGVGGIEVRGPGQLLIQAGGDIDLGRSTVAVNGEIVGGLVATGDTRNPRLSSNRSARLTVIAGVSADLDLTRMDPAYLRIREVNRLNGEISSLYAQLELEGESGRAAVLGAESVASLVSRNAAYSRFVALDKAAPEALASYQLALRQGSLPLGDGADAQTARRLLQLLAKEDDLARLTTAGSVSRLLVPSGNGGSVTLGGEALDAAAVAALSNLGERYPTLYAGAVTRRVNGAQLTAITPLVFDQMLTGIVASFIPSASLAGGSIFSFQTSIQTLGGSDIDLWAPAGNIVVGLTTPNADRPVGLLTNAGGGIRSVLSGDFNINQGKVLTAQGGDILLYSAQGSIDAGRGAKTSLSTPAPQRRPILDSQGNQIGVQVVIPASATGSGIQTLTSDPDGQGPAATPLAGDVYLFAPAGKIDAGEAGIRSSGNILINAQVVLNASDIRSTGASQGVPVAATGSLASALTTGGATNNSSSQAADSAAKNAEQTARQAASAALPKPTILVVEVLGFGDKNCKEQDKNCFAK